MSASPRATIETDRLCSVVASVRAEDPIGSGYHIARALAIEVPTPWGASFYESDPAGTLRQRTAAMVAANYQRLSENPPPGGAFPDGYAGVFAIAPDREYSDPTKTKALLITRPTGPFRQFEIAEYDFPLESERLLDLVAGFLLDEPDYTAVEEFRVPHGGQREFMVCTHGQVDMCCGKFGFPLYVEARRLEGARVWRASHFGGHRYAPTAWEFPSGYMWGFLDGWTTSMIMSHEGDPAVVSPKMRGTSGLGAQLQLLDRVGFEEHGWAWPGFERTGSAEAVEGEERRWRVRLAYRSPEGETGTYEGEVSVAREFPAIGCGAEESDSTYRVPEYRLGTVTRTRGTAFPVLAVF